MYHPENDYPYHGFHPGDQPTWLKWLTPSVAIVTVLVLLALASCARPAYAQGCISPEFVAGKMQTGDFQPEGRRLSPQKSVAYLALVGHEHPNGQSPDFFVVLYRAKNETMTRVFEFEGGCYAGYFDVEDPEA